MEPPFHAHEDTSCFTLSHSPGIASNAVGIKMPYVRWREWGDNDKPSSFPAISHFVLRKCCAFCRSKLYSPIPSSFAHKITPCQHELCATTFSKAATANWFILLCNERHDKIEDRRHFMPRRTSSLFLRTVRPIKKPLKWKSWTFGFFFGCLRMCVLAVPRDVFFCSYWGWKTTFF